MKSLILFISIISSNAFAMNIYLLNTEIGGHIFKDYLILDNLIESNQTSPFTGTLTVPGQFSTKILNPNIQDKIEFKLLTFNISTKENGNILEANYKLELLNNNQKIKGVLMIEGDNYNVEGKKIYAE